MNPKGFSLGPSSPVIREALAILCVVMLSLGGPAASAQQGSQQESQQGGASAESAKLTNDQLDSLVAYLSQATGGGG